MGTFLYLVCAVAEDDESFILDAIVEAENPAGAMDQFEAMRKYNDWPEPADTPRVWLIPELRGKPGYWRWGTDLTSENHP